MPEGTIVGKLPIGDDQSEMKIVGKLPSTEDDSKPAGKLVGKLSTVPTGKIVGRIQPQEDEDALSAMEQLQKNPASFASRDLIAAADTVLGIVPFGAQVVEKTAGKIAREIAPMFGVEPSSALVINQRNAINLLKRSNITPLYVNNSINIGVGKRGCTY